MDRKASSTRGARVGRILIIGLLMPLLAVGCAGPGGTPIAGTASPTTEEPTLSPSPVSVNIRLGFQADPRYSWTYLAEKMGFFAEEGLKVAIDDGQGSAQVTQTVATGLDFMASPNLESAVLLRGQGAPIKIVAVLEQETSAVILVRGDSAIRSPQDLAGKTILTGPGSTAILLQPYLRAQGVDPATVTIINSDHGTKLTNFLAGKGDAVTVFATNEAVRIRAMDPKARTFSFADVFDLPGAVLIVNDSAIDNQPEVVRAMVRALLKGIDAARRQPSEAVDALAAVLPDRVTDRDIAVQQVSVFLDLVYEKGPDKVGTCDDQRMNAVFDVLAKHMAFNGNRNVSEYCTNQFLP